MRLYIKYPHPYIGNLFLTCLISSEDDIAGQLTAADKYGNIQVEPNAKSERFIRAVMNGDIPPKKTFVIGTAYFGRTQFRIRYLDKKARDVSVQIFTALGSTLEEHNARYKRLRNILNENNTGCSHD